MVNLKHVLLGCYISSSKHNSGLAYMSCKLVSTYNTVHSSVTNSDNFLTDGITSASLLKYLPQNIKPSAKVQCTVLPIG